MPDSVCLFAAYAPMGELPPHTAYYLSELIHCGFTVHLALSGCKEPSEKTIIFCNKKNIIIWCRSNSGYDFGAWKELILQDCTKNTFRVLLANDSVFGPFTSLSPIFDRMEKENGDVWGLAHSRSVIPHLQSWFICFEHNSFHAPAVQRTLLQNFNHMTRDELIWHGELGLALACRVEGLNTKAAWNNHTMLDRLFKTNVMHSQWRRVIRSEKIPFIKTELLRDNPFHLRSTSRWKDALPAETSFNPEWITHYLSINGPRPGRPQINRKCRLLYALIEKMTG